MLQINEIDVYYDEFHVLSKVSLHIEKGECVTILGANGAGKSTIIKAISGLVPITSGDMLFQDTSIKDIPAHEVVNLGIVHVPEGRRLFPALSVLDNLLLGAYCKRAKADRDKRLEEILELLPGLKIILKRLAGSLSGGEQQMCAIGRGLMTRPTLLMLDEPSLGLAPKIVEEVFAIIQRINNLGTAILLVEQNVNMSMEVSHRAYVLENGRVTIEGLASDLKDNQELRKAYLGI